MKDMFIGVALGLAVIGLMGFVANGIVNEERYKGRCHDVSGVPMGGRSPHICFIEGTPIDVSRSDYTQQAAKIREKTNAQGG